MHDDYPDTVFFFGYPPDRAEAFYAAQLDWIDCLCDLGMIWRDQWETQVETIPLETDIHGV